MCGNTQSPTSFANVVLRNYSDKSNDSEDSDDESKDPDDDSKDSDDDSKDSDKDSQTYEAKGTAVLDSKMFRVLSSIHKHLKKNCSNYMRAYDTMACILMISELFPEEDGQGNPMLEMTVSEATYVVFDRL